MLDKKTFRENNFNLNTPTIFVIFGATGDLARKKLFKSIFNLFSSGSLPSKFKIVAYSRRDLNDASFRDFVLNVFNDSGIKYEENEFKTFLDNAYYQKGDFKDSESYINLSKKLQDIDKIFGLCSNKLLYLATPPSLYEVILENIKKSGLSVPCGGDLGWTRILIEKPFGVDFKSASALDKKLGDMFKEEQIFRIDHYLAKETLQNVTAFRFKNNIFEPAWNNKFISKIEVSLFEKDNAESRLEFYEGVGALRDVGQNHILMMLSLVLMQKPNGVGANLVRMERAKAIRKIEIKKIDKNYLWKGQYDGYANGKGSNTETAFKIKVFSSDKKMSDVPIFLSSGKALNENLAEIKIYFRSTDKEVGNVLTFAISPKEGIKIAFYAKRPGLDNVFDEKDLEFSYPIEGGVIRDAYEKVLYDCVVGDQTLFASTEEIKASWKLIGKILKNWNSIALQKYERGYDLKSVDLN